MRAELTEKGMMYIIAETPVEGYALSRWSENQVHNENITFVWDKKWFRVGTFNESCLNGLDTNGLKGNDNGIF